MQKNHLTILLCFCLGYSSCSPNKKAEPAMEIEQSTDSIVCLNNDSLSATDTIRLNQMAESVTYMSLDMPNTSNIFQLEYTDSLIFVNDMQGVYWFNHKGEEIGRISSRCNCFDLSTQKDSIYIYQPLEKRLSCYNLKGEQIWTSRVHYPEKNLGYYGHFFAQLNDSIFIIAIKNQGFNKDRLVFINKKGKIKGQIHNPEMFPYPGSQYSRCTDWQRQLTHNQQQVFYHPMYGDTVYCIHDDMQLIPVIVEQKIKKVPLEYRPEYTGKTYEQFALDCHESSMYVTRIFNASRYVIIEYRLGGIEFCMPNYWVYDRKEKIWRRSFNDIMEALSSRCLHLGIYNDYDGGLAFAPDFISNDHLIMVNAGGVQSHERTTHAKQLYANNFNMSGKQCIYRSDVYKESSLKQKADTFWENCEEKKLILTIVKMKQK